MAYVPVAFILAGMAAYTVLAGADFGAGLWTLLALGPSGQRVRDQARHAMGPVWEANHVWLIFVLVVCWTAYPVAFGSIMSTLSAPLLIAAIGIILRGAAYALRGVADGSRTAENLLGLSSVLTPFALGTAVGAIALGRVPVGNAAGNLVTSWLFTGPVLIGALAVAFSAYLAAVFLAADSLRYADAVLAGVFRRRALVAGVLSGGLALAGLLVMRGSGLDLTHGAALVLVCVSGAAGLATLALCWRSRFGLARLTAALAVAAVVVGWAAAQAPRFLPGMTVVQAAAGRATLVALVIAVACGSVVLIPSLTLLFTLYLRGRLDTPEHHVPGEAPAAPLGEAAPPETAALPGEAAPSGTAAPSDAAAPPGFTALPGTAAPSAKSGGADETPESAAPSAGPRGAARPLGTAGRWVAAAIGGLVPGTGLLVFTDATWTHVLGVAGLILCAVAAFALTASPLDR
jgi:cytochrome bd ubiquinol oxidase subunit II